MISLIFYEYIKGQVLVNKYETFTVYYINVVIYLNYNGSRFDKQNDGSISATDFYQLMTTVKGHLLTHFTRNNLIAVAGGTSSAHKVRFPFYQAFNSLLAKMELIKRGMIHVILK